MSDGHVEIKPCPWCGKQPRVDGSEGGWTFPAGFWVICGVIGGDEHNVTGPERTTKAGAIKAWNERRVR